LTTYGTTDYIHVDQPGQYMVDRVAESESWEVSDPGELTLTQLKAAVDQADWTTAPRTVQAHTRNYYDGNGFEGLALGSIGVYGAMVRAEQLVLTDDIIDEAYPSGATGAAIGELQAAWVPGDEPAFSRTIDVTYQIEFGGTVALTDTSGAAISGARVELVNLERVGEKPLRSVVTDQNGEAEIAFGIKTVIDFYGRFVRRFAIRVWDDSLGTSGEDRPPGPASPLRPEDSPIARRQARLLHRCSRATATDRV
jgi:hypothetical protein